MAMGSVIGEIKKLSSYKILSAWKKQNRAILREIAVSGQIPLRLKTQATRQLSTWRTETYTMHKINKKGGTVKRFHPTKTVIIKKARRWRAFDLSNLISK